MESQTKVSKVKQDIKGEVKLIFGLAFFVMYLACEILLFLTENNHSYFFIKSIILIGVFLAMNILCVKLVGIRINSLFEPVDRYVADSDEVIDSLSRENQENKDSIKEANKTHEGFLNRAKSSARESAKLGKNIGKNKEVTDKILIRECEIYRQIDELIGDIRVVKMNMFDSSGAIDDKIKTVCELSKEIYDDYEEINKSYDKLGALVNASSDNIEGLISDLGLMQADLSLLGTNATRLALDNARNGSYSFAMTNGLDEIKRVSSKVDDRTDSIAKYAMATKNSIKLIDDQADYCIEGQQRDSKAFSRARELTLEVSEGISKMSEGSGSLLNKINTLVGLINELERLNKQKQNLMNNTYDESGVVVKLLNNMGESLKSK